MASADSDVDMESDEGESDTGYHPKKALLRALEDWIPEFYQPRGSNRKFPSILITRKKVPKLEAITVGPPEAKVAKNKDKSEEKKEEEMEIDSTKDAGIKNKKKIKESEPLGVDDLVLMCDLFYLPYEHGAKALDLLRSAHWLINNTQAIKDCQKLPRVEQVNSVLLIQ